MARGRRPSALGCYIYAGGFTLGVREHFKVLGHLEGPDGYGVPTVKYNLPTLPVWTGNWDLDALADEMGQIDLVYGNPPCAAWSRAGVNQQMRINKEKSFKSKWKYDERVDCTRHHFSLLEKLQPRAWVWESVCQAYTMGHEFVDDLTERAQKLGYDVTYLMHDARWLGVPQMRPRFFFVATRFAFTPITPNWAPPQTVVEALAEVVARDDDEPFTVNNKVFSTDNMATWPPGTDARRFWEDNHPPARWRRNHLGHVVGRPSFGHRRLHFEKPATTVAGYVLVHPTEPRVLTVREHAHLCGFPAGYQFVGKNAYEKARQIARGVCPPVGRWVAHSLARSMEEDRYPTRSIKLIDLKNPPKGATA